MPRSQRQRSAEASIYQETIKANGKVYTYWTVSRTLGYYDGKQKRETVRLKTEKEARAKLRELLKESPRQAGPSLTLEGYFRSFLDSKRKLKPTTATTYENIFNYYIQPVLGRARLDRIEPQDVEHLLDVVSQRKSAKGRLLSSTSVLKVYTVLATALNHAKRQRLIPYNPAESVEPPAIADFKARIWTQEEAARFFKAVNGDAISPVFAVALGMGLRMGEVLGLTWDNIDADWSGLTVGQQLQWLEPRHVANKPARQLSVKSSGKRQAYLITPKTKASLAWLPLPKEIAAILQAHKARQSAAQLAGKWRNVDNLVFTTSSGTPYSARNVQREHARYLAKAGLPKSRFHDLRHSCVSALGALGVDPKIRSAIARHADVRMTLDVYEQVSPDQMRRAMDLAGHLIPTGTDSK